MEGMLRPKMRVLPDAAMVETEATHTVSGRQPYFLKRPADSGPRSVQKLDLIETKWASAVPAV